MPSPCEQNLVVVGIAVAAWSAGGACWHKAQAPAVPSPYKAPTITTLSLGLGVDPKQSPGCSLV